MELRPLSQIRANEENPRLIKTDDFARLVNSLVDFPEMLYLRPAVVDEHGTVLGGNMRLRAKHHLLALSEAEKVLMMAEAKTRRLDKEPELEGAEYAAYEVLMTELFHEPVLPVVVAVGLTEDQKREFVIKDNTGFGEWDWDELANGGWGDMPLADWGMDIPKDWLNTEILDEIALPDGDKPPFVQKSFYLTDLQGQDVDTALMLAKAEAVDNFEGTGNDNSNGNALAAVVAFYISAKRKEEE